MTTNEWAPHMSPSVERFVGSSADQRPATWDDEADVIVIGYGFAGVAAAITAHDSGAKVLMLEKAPEAHKGGNSRVSGNIVFWPDNVEKAKAYLKGLIGPYGDNISEKMIQVWATEMHANRAWLEGLGMKPVALAAVPAEFPELDGSDCVQILVHGDGSIGDERLWRGVTEPAMAARHIRTLYETAAVRLVKDKGEIVGVVADRRGTTMAIKANRAVVLACGGFENNPAMIHTYLTGLPRIYPSGTPYNTGDGVRMGLEVGADLWHMSNISGPVFFFKAPEIPVSGWINTPHAASYMFVAGDGARFTAEGQQAMGADRHGKIKYHGAWMQQPAPVPVYFIFDESVRKAGPLGRAHADWDVSHDGRYAWSDDNLREVEKGWIRTAETVRDLAGLIQVPPDALEASVARFNRFAAAGRDADFGRNPASLAALKTSPYYAIELTPTFINTQGGPRRNEDAQVIGADGRPIPRLYSAGELGSIYAFLYQGGGNIGECFAFGRIAGANAAREERQEVEAIAEVSG
ncbi:MAG: FAD-dependent oxidoreductase [Methylovirgula sp.]|uniref:FAD-dependent oxidoreductase n=1 Tax=Methylovirgula sp. TaxID=1978224 RepID=UPI003075FE47